MIKEHQNQHIFTLYSTTKISARITSERYRKKVIEKKLTPPEYQKLEDDLRRTQELIDKSMIYYLAFAKELDEPITLTDEEILRLRSGGDKTTFRKLIDAINDLEIVNKAKKVTSLVDGINEVPTYLILDNGKNRTVPDPYLILGVQLGASQSDIKTAYRSLQKVFTAFAQLVDLPQRFKTIQNKANSAAQKINNALDTISNHDQISRFNEVIKDSEKLNNTYKMIKIRNFIKIHQEKLKDLDVKNTKASELIDIVFGKYPINRNEFEIFTTDLLEIEKDLNEFKDLTDKNGGIATEILTFFGVAKEIISLLTDALEVLIEDLSADSPPVRQRSTRRETQFSSKVYLDFERSISNAYTIDDFVTEKPQVYEAEQKGKITFRESNQLIEIIKQKAFKYAQRNVDEASHEASYRNAKKICNKLLDENLISSSQYYDLRGEIREKRSNSIELLITLHMSLDQLLKIKETIYQAAHTGFGIDSKQEERLVKKLKKRAIEYTENQIRMANTDSAIDLVETEVVQSLQDAFVVNSQEANDLKRKIRSKKIDGYSSILSRCQSINQVIDLANKIKTEKREYRINNTKANELTDQIKARATLIINDEIDQLKLFYTDDFSDEVENSVRKLKSNFLISSTEAAGFMKRIKKTRRRR